MFQLSLSMKSQLNVNSSGQRDSIPEENSLKYLRGPLFIVRARNKINKADSMNTKRTTFPLKMKIGGYIF